jgi:hypothetical protein
MKKSVFKATYIVISNVPLTEEDITSAARNMKQLLSGRYDDDLELEVSVAATIPENRVRYTTEEEK